MIARCSITDPLIDMHTTAHVIKSMSVVSQIDHNQIDHSQIDHSQIDHSQIDQHFYCSILYILYVNIYVILYVNIR